MIAAERLETGHCEVQNGIVDQVDILKAASPALSNINEDKTRSKWKEFMR